MILRVLFAALSLSLFFLPTAAFSEKFILEVKNKEELNEFKNVARNRWAFAGTLFAEINSKDDRFVNAAVRAVDGIVFDLEKYSQRAPPLAVLMLKEDREGKSYLSFFAPGDKASSISIFQTADSYSEISAERLETVIRERILKSLLKNVGRQIYSPRLSYGYQNGALSGSSRTPWSRKLDVAVSSFNRTNSDEDKALISDLETEFHNRIYVSYLLEALATNARYSSPSIEAYGDSLDSLAAIEKAAKTLKEGAVLNLRTDFLQRYSLPTFSEVLTSFFGDYAIFAPERPSYARGLEKARAVQIPHDLNRAIWNELSLDSPEAKVVSTILSKRYRDFGEVSTIEKIDLPWKKGGFLMRVRGLNYEEHLAMYIIMYPGLEPKVLDGKSNYFVELNQVSPPVFDEETVKSYIWIFTFFLHAGGAPFLIVETDATTFLPKNLDEDSLDKVGRHARRITCEPENDVGEYNCTTVMLLKNKLIEAYITVDSGGIVEMKGDKELAKGLSEDVSVTIDPTAF